MQNGYVPIYLDETGANLWTTPRHGWSRKGERARAPTYSSPGPHITLIAVLCPFIGIVYHELLEAPLNKDLFSSFIQSFTTFIAHILPNLNLLLILYNLSSHFHSPLHDFWVQGGHLFLFLPPYSPQLNPIEEAFSAIKNRVRKGIASRYVELCKTDHLPLGQRAYVRSQMVLEEFSAALFVVDHVNAKDTFKAKA